MAPTPPIVCIPQEGEAWASFVRRIMENDGPTVVLFAGREAELLQQKEARDLAMKEFAKMRNHLVVATKHPQMTQLLRKAHVRTVDRTKQLKLLIEGSALQNEALRVFSPHLWRQQLKSQLQRMGLLSMPRLRIFGLVGLSIVLFGFVVLKLLPSAEIYISPRRETVTQTINVFLLGSGANLEAAERVRSMPLIPIRVTSQRETTFDHISKEFIGTPARIQLTVMNNREETYSFRAGTRFMNQAGVVFRSKNAVIVPAKGEATISAESDALDVYNEIIGDRGNVPAGLKWDIPGIDVSERPFVYAINRKAGSGGTTAYRTVLKQEDLDLAKQSIERDMVEDAQILVSERLQELNAGNPAIHLRLIEGKNYATTVFGEITLPTDLIGTELSSIPVRGSVVYTAFAYDAQAILNMLRKELTSHVREGKRLLEDNIGLESVVVHIIDSAEDLSWVKFTVDLTASEEYVLDPLSPNGLLFGKKVRDQVVGLPKSEALKIVKNMPEVENAEVHMWPPWSRTLPTIPSHISIVAP